MKLGDFSKLAKNYIHRTGYPHSILKNLYTHAQIDPQKAITADVGAGTGKLTENLIELGFKGFAIEPNDAMRQEGQRLFTNTPFKWSKGSGEKTGLPNNSVDWVLMGSSFHWTDPKKSLKEFNRILKPGGFFVALWNPRDLESSTFHMEIEEWLYKRLPKLKRISSGNNKYMKNLEYTLVQENYFKDVTFMEESYQVEMTPDRYFGIWKSVNDIRAQIGEEIFQEFLDYIKFKIENKQSIIVPYKARAWIVQVI
ncbi:MAG: class I SAM-dependent methyltransferase [Halobacteriovoraceae bacterium]|nr:class I SAM-dependent methyltransferase [Halobacteriovoraceae bacterium]